jgi:geranylgeranyl diphosphate synthase type II
MITSNQIQSTLEQGIAESSYGESPVELYEPITYIMSLSGKRLRPVLTLLATAVFSADWQKALKPALAVELFHNFTLMHDDIMDDAPLRRGKPTIHEKWNANTAILSGDVMLVKAYDFLVDIDKEYLQRVLIRFNKTAAEVCEGQQLDMNFESRQDVTEEDYINMIRLKTSVLLGFALELGGILGGADEKSIQLLYEAGVNIGLGFQLTDDLLDVYGDPSKFGKQVGGDIIANKKTFLLIEAITLAQGDAQKELQHWLSAADFNKREKVTAVTAIYDQLGIRARTEEKINDYFAKGFDALQQLEGNSEQKTVLSGFVQQLIVREN